MAFTDLANYDILDLLLTSTYSDDEKGRYIVDYMDAFAGYMGEIVADRLSIDDAEAMKKLLADAGVTPEKIEQFYRDRIPHFDTYLLLAVLQFKKSFLLDYYRSMLEATTKQKDPSISLWVKIVAAAEEDKWDVVSHLAKHIQEKFYHHIPQSTI